MITPEDLAHLAREVHARARAGRSGMTAAAGMDLADAVLARDAETAAERLAEREARLAYHESMRDVQQRAIDRLRLAMTETDQS